MWADQVGDQDYTWSKFLPYFEKSLNFTPPDASKRAANATPDYDTTTLGQGNGPLSVTFPNYAQAYSSWVQKGLQEIGIQPRKGFTSGGLIGSAYSVATIESTLQTRESSESAYLQPALTNPDLTIYTQTLATQIIFDSNKVATGVQVNTAGKVYTLSAGKEVIVSAGTFQSPQLLMVSGVGPQSTLSQFNIPVVADRPGVGQNMWVSSCRSLTTNCFSGTDMVRIIYFSGLPTGSTSLLVLLLPTQRLARKQQLTTIVTRLVFLPVQGGISWVRPHPTAIGYGANNCSVGEDPALCSRKFHQADYDRSSDFPFRLAGHRISEHRRLLWKPEQFHHRCPT